MNEKKKELQCKKERFTWYFLIMGAVIFLVGLAVRRYLPGLPLQPAVIEGIGVGFLLFTLINLIRLRLVAKKQPLSLQRELVEEQDERNRSIRGRAGRNGFIVAMALNFLVLFVYSYATQDQPGFDLLWFALAGMFIVPMLVYIISEMVLQNRE